MAEYPTEEPAHHVDVQPSPASAAAPGGFVTSQQVRDARDRLAQRRREHDQHVAKVMREHDFHEKKLPPVQDLREERVRLSEQIRHHKDEQDSLTLDIEGQEGATAVYQIAARVQRYEHFAAHSNAYVKEQLPREIDELIAEDNRRSEEEIATYIQELQDKRERTLQRVSAAQARSAKRGSKAGLAADDAPADDELTQRAIAHAEENVNEAQTLSEKVRKFRALKTKLSSELVREKQESVRAEQQLNARIKNAELANARDARQCRELNSGNAALTTNSQLLLSQLNVEHYGMDNAPTNAQLIEDRKAREATPEPTPVDGSQRRYGRGASGASIGSRQNGGDAVSVSSRQSRPPLVASKPTESQKSRDQASLREREEQRRAAEVGSHTSSRRQSLSKPPLVASKATASQRNRDELTKQEREEMSVSRQRAGSVSSKASGANSRPVAVA